jgi:hypothetical protein
MTRPARHLATLLAAAAVLAVTVTAAPAAQARSGAAPVTAADSVTTYPGNYTSVELLDNDSDAEGDSLKVCQNGGEHYPKITADFSKTDVSFAVKTKAKPGTYVYTYFACDGTSQTAGTVTLVVATPPKIKLRQVSNGLGKLRATSKAPFKVRIAYGTFGEESPDGYVVVPKKGSAVFTVHRTKIDWVASTMNGDFLASGHVRGILLPRAS